MKCHAHAAALALAAVLAAVAAADDGAPPAPPPRPPSTGTTAGAPAPPATPPKPGDAGAAAQAAALERALAVEGQLVDALAKVRPASVSVINKKPRKKGDPPTLAGVGSGVIVSWKSKTWIVTNDHVIDGAAALEVVVSDGRTLPVELVDVVKVYDIALLRFTGRVTGVKGVPIVAKASQELEEGQWVLATGNPFFLATDGASVASLGVVSGKDRVLGSGHVYGRAIQHDAAVNPGNSGGPLWNLKGELVGINGMIASRGGGGVGASNTGASFSIPIDMIQPYLDKLVDAKQDAQAGFLGLDVDTATDAKGTPNGAKVTAVHPRSPVRQDGDPMFVGDVIVSMSVAGKVIPIVNGTDLVNALTSYPAGTAVRIRYRRNGRETVWSGKLGAQN